MDIQVGQLDMEKAAVASEVAREDGAVADRVDGEEAQEDLLDLAKVAVASEVVREAGGVADIKDGEAVDKEDGEAVDKEDGEVAKGAGEVVEDIVASEDKADMEAMVDTEVREHMVEVTADSEAVMEAMAGKSGNKFVLLLNNLN